MPLLTFNIKIDQFQLKHSRDADDLRKAIFESHAKEIGMKILELFPFQKISEYEGDLPAAVLTRDHKFVEEWQIKAVVKKNDSEDYNQAIDNVDLFLEEWCKSKNDSTFYYYFHSQLHPKLQSLKK